MPRSRILYAVRDDAAAADHVALLYRHVELLAAAGFDAHVLRQGAPPPAFARSPAPVIEARTGLRLSGDDRLATPELWSDMLQVNRRLRQRRILVCQDELLLAHSLASTAPFAELGVARVVATGASIAAFVRRQLGYDAVAVVPAIVDLELFRPAGKRRQIAYRPRARSREALFIEALFRRTHPDLADIPWILLDGADAASSAEILGRSAYFLGMGLIEGTYTPALEAMAADALVAGFPGLGGRDIATPDNGEWSPDGDSIKAVEALGRLIRMAERDPAAAARRRAAGRATAARHGRSAVAAALCDFWSDELGRSAGRD